MANGINRAILVGNLGRDPEIRYTAGGTTMAKLSIATSETWRDRQSGKRLIKDRNEKVSIAAMKAIEKQNNKPVRG